LYRILKQTTFKNLFQQIINYCNYFLIFDIIKQKLKIMKKLLLSILTLASVASFAQKDISVTLNSPAANATIVAGTQFTITATITNAGSVALTASDTIFVAYKVGSSYITSGGNPLVTIVTHGNIAVGGTATVSTNLTLTFTTAGGNTFCVQGFLENGGLVDGNASNDNGCSPVFFSLNAGVNEVNKIAQSVKVFPNPAKDIINFSVDGNMAKTVSVMDITGKLLENISITDSETKLDLSSYSNGIYLYQIKASTGEVIKSGKFNVTK
jgi:hypothetical protein